MVNSIAIDRPPGKVRRQRLRDPGKRFFRLADGTKVAFQRREGIVDADDVRQGRSWLTFAQAYMDTIVLPVGIWSTPRMVYCDDKECGNLASVYVDLFADRMLCREKLGWLRHFLADQLGRQLWLNTADDGEDSAFGCWVFDVQVRLFRHVWSMRRYRTEPWDDRWYDAFLDGARE